MNLSDLPPQPERGFIASMEQIAELRLVSLEEGAGRGMCLFRRTTGPG